MRARLADRLSRALALTAINKLAAQPVAVVDTGPGSGPPPGHGTPGQPPGAGQPPAGPPTGPTVLVHDPAAYRRVLLGGSVGLAQSYVARLWDCEDLVELLRIATRSLPGQAAHGTDAAFVARAPALLANMASALAGLSHLLSRAAPPHHPRQGRRADRLNVGAHYDLGNEFFALFLDPTMTYSCAIFEQPGTTLEEASLAKLDSICELLGLGPGDEVLEIGGGWGSFALRAAGERACQVTTTTISERQYDLARQRVGQAGLAGRVSVLKEHYLDLKGTWDKIACIEMVEAVNWRRHDQFFGACSGLLRPGGQMALQAIVIDGRFYERAKRSQDFIKTMVFPGSTIPSLGRLTSCAERAGLRAASCRHIGHHYVKTLAHWRENFLAHREAIAALGLPPELLRLWDLYLAYCQAGFAEGRLDDVQILFSKA